MIDRAVETKIYEDKQHFILQALRQEITVHIQMLEGFKKIMKAEAKQ